MALSDSGKNIMLDALGGAALFASLHTADPGTAGDNEATGGSPAYARQSVTWSAAATGNLDSSNQPAFNVPAGTYTHFGLWSASSGGTFYGGGALAASETFAAQGTYTLTDADVNLT